MIRVCAWCGKAMGEREPMEDKSITHGICPECYEKVTGKPYTGISLTEKPEEAEKPLPEPELQLPEIPELPEE